MKTQRQAGFGTVGIIAVVAVVAAGGYMLLQSGSSTSNEAAGTAPATVNDTITNAEAVVQDAVAGVESVNGEPMEENHSSDDMSETMMKDDDAAMKEAEMSESETVVTETQSVVTTTPGTFEAYSTDKLALANSGDVVLFFHAAWCPSCRGLENDINANLSGIPAGTHILKIDYDSETALKKKYGVVRQHTLIQVDQNGDVVKRLTGLTNTLSQVAGQLN